MPWHLWVRPAPRRQQLLICVPYLPLSSSFLRLENGGPNSWGWPGAIHSTSVGPQAFIPGKSTPGHSCLGGTGLWRGQERNPIGRCTWTRSCRKEGSFLIDEFGKGISERGNRQHKSLEVQGCLVHSGKGMQGHGWCLSRQICSIPYVSTWTRTWTSL